MGENVFSMPLQRGAVLSTPRSAALRQKRFEDYYKDLKEPEEYTKLAERAKEEYIRWEENHPAIARAKAMRIVVENCPMEIGYDNVLIGGESPFMFNLMLPALWNDRYAKLRGTDITREEKELSDYSALIYGPCFDGHITPGLEQILGQGLSGLRMRVEEHRDNLKMRNPEDTDTLLWYDAALMSIENLSIYAVRCVEAALRAADSASDAIVAADLRESAAVMKRVSEKPAATFREALQAYWTCYCLVTVEMGGCMPGGGLGLGRPDQYLYPYFKADIDSGRITREQALEYMEMFLLNFRHVDFYTPHSIFTTGSHGSLGGITPTGLPAYNDLTELIMEASVRIFMPTPYLSVRMFKGAPEGWWKMAARYIMRGLGFPVVNDEAIIGAMLRHGRSLGDARDYICSCCYENTIPGREAFNPNGAYLNLAKLLEMTIFGGEVLTGDAHGISTGLDFPDFESLWNAFEKQMRYIMGILIEYINRMDKYHSTYRRYPMMSLFMDDCIAKGKDVCSGGARYNLTGIIVSALPNFVNSLYALKQAVYVNKVCTFDELRAALKANYKGYEELQLKLKAYPKWGNGNKNVDSLAARVTELLYDCTRSVVNYRGGRMQLALYSFMTNHHMGSKTGATPDGRLAGESLTRNLNPTWGTDKIGPTAVLQSLSAIDFTGFPDGCSLDLRFDPAAFKDEEGQEKFAAFLKGFVDTGVMQMQISMVDTDTLIDARNNPEKYPNLMVKVAGYSARFIDLPDYEKDELIGRSNQRI